MALRTVAGWHDALGPPADYPELLEPLPEGATIADELPASASFVHLFTRERAVLEVELPRLVAALEKDGVPEKYRDIAPRIQEGTDNLIIETGDRLADIQKGSDTLRIQTGDRNTEIMTGFPDTFGFTGELAARFAPGHELSIGIAYDESDEISRKTKTLKTSPVIEMPSSPVSDRIIAA